MYFPIARSHAHLAKQTDYVGDPGADIAVPLGTPIVAVGSGIIQYAEWGHTPWKGRYATVAPYNQYPNDTAFSARLQLDTPIIWNGEAYPEVFYTHLLDVVSYAPGVRVNEGDLIGHSGLGRHNSHLHIAFYRHRADEVPIPSPDDWQMIWGWLDKQGEPQKPKEDDVAYGVKIKGPVKQARMTGFSGEFHGQKGLVILTLTAAKLDTTNVEVTVIPKIKDGKKRTTNVYAVKGRRAIDFPVGGDVNGKFTVDVKSTNDKNFVVELEQWWLPINP